MIADEEIGGAYVRRIFSKLGEHLRPGQRLTRDEVLSMNRANRRALIDAGYLEVWPRPPIQEAANGRFLAHRGGGAYDVYAMKLNAEPLSKEEAERLANAA